MNVKPLCMEGAERCYRKPRPSAPASFGHYRRKRTTKAPRKRTFLLAMSKHTPRDTMMAKPSRHSAELFSTGGACTPCCGGNDGSKGVGGGNGRGDGGFSGFGGADDAFNRAAPTAQHQAMLLALAALGAGAVAPASDKLHALLQLMPQTAVAVLGVLAAGVVIQPAAAQAATPGLVNYSTATTTTTFPAAAAAAAAAAQAAASSKSTAGQPVLRRVRGRGRPSMSVDPAAIPYGTVYLTPEERQLLNPQQYRVRESILV